MDIGNLIWLVVIGTTVWVGIDASKRDWSNDRFASSEAIWIVGCVLLWIVVFPIYLIRRRRAPLKGAAPAFTPPPPVWSAPLGTPVALTEGMKRCPFCAEEIQSAAVLCRHCNSSLAPAAGLSGPLPPAPTTPPPGSP